VIGAYLPVSLFCCVAAYVDILRSLVPKFPLTLRGLENAFILVISPNAENLTPEAKAKVTAQLPYKLVSSRTHLNALVPGRQKAIEVG
jgi:hypothetical protein